MLTEQLKKAFDLGGKAILEISQEVEDLSTRFGTNSTIVKKKAEQAAALLELHTIARQEINRYRKALHLAYVIDKAKEMIILRHETKVSWERLAKLYGWDQAAGADMDVKENKWEEFIINLEKLTGN